MEWVETTGKTVDEAKEAALDQLGVHESDAEFVVVEEPKAGLSGRVKGEARVRARVRPTAPRPKRGRSRRSGEEAPAPGPVANGGRVAGRREAIRPGPEGDGHPAVDDDTRRPRGKPREAAAVRRRDGAEVAPDGDGDAQAPPTGGRGRSGGSMAGGCGRSGSRRERQRAAAARASGNGAGGRAGRRQGQGGDGGTGALA